MASSAAPARRGTGRAPRGRATSGRQPRRTPRPSASPGRGRPTHPPARRLVALFVILSLALVGVLARLVLLQVRDASALQAYASGQRERTLALPADRGTIFDRNGKELAISLPAEAVFADPTLVTDPAREARAVASSLALKYADVHAAMTHSGRFVYLARGVDPTRASALESLHLPGIGFLQESRRYYPSGALAPQVVGFVGIDGTGLSGLELEYQRLLAGRAGHEVVQQDPHGTLIPQAGSVMVPPLPGDDLIVTVDREIQYQAQQALQAAVEANGAKGGTVIVMDPHTGDILAMVSYPWFDPNHASSADPEVIRNKAVTDAYEPGSVNKVITASAALQEGVINLNQRMMVPDHLQLYTKTFTDAHSHETEPMTIGDIIAYSSNIGAIKTAGLLGTFRFARYLYRFGLGSKTGSGFPGESPGILPPPGNWSGTGMGTIPIGQGIAVTPLQMACVYATIANGGVWVRPRFIRATVGPEGAVQRAPASPTRRVVSASTARAVSGLLGFGVDVGTGTEAQIPGYWVAGKTGTARKPRADGTGYSDKYDASFIGFTPAARPALVVAAVLDEPVTEFGGIAAAPLFQQVARFALARLRVPPAPKLPIPPHAIPLG